MSKSSMQENRVKMAGVYRLSSSSLVHAASFHAGRGAVDSPPFELLPNSAGSEEFGRAMRYALDASTSGKSFPETEEDREALRRTTALAAKVKNYASFMRQAKVHCVVSQGFQVNQITVEGFKRRRPGGFTLEEDDYSQGLAADASNLELGRAIRDALGLSTG